MGLFRKRHECWPPNGAVFEPTWTCEDCGTTWRLIEHATYTEWVREEKS